MAIGSWERGILVGIILTHVALSGEEMVGPILGEMGHSRAME